MSVCAYWFTGWDNFGDRLAPWLISELGHCAVEHAEEPYSKPKLVTVGSSLGQGRLCKGDVVCGAGFMDPTCQAIEKEITVTAVRGPLSRAILLGHGIACPAIYGDPAMLLPLIYRPQVKQRKGVGVIPHGNDTWLAGRGGDKRIHVRDDPKKVIDEICACDVIVSSALHGLIVAEAYGIPAALCRSSAQVFDETPFKYQDYYHGTGRTDVLHNIDGTVADAAKQACLIKKPLIDLRFAAAFRHAIALMRAK